MGDLKSLIENVDDADYATVQVPEWGADVVVRVRTLTGAERDWLLTNKLNVDATTGTANPEVAGFQAAVCALCLVDEDGRRVFEDTAEGVEMLGNRNADVIDRIAKSAMDLNGMSAEVVEETVEDFGEALSG